MKKEVLQYSIFKYRIIFYLIFYLFEWMLFPQFSLYPYCISQTFPGLISFFYNIHLFPQILTPYSNFRLTPFSKTKERKRWKYDSGILLFSFNRGNFRKNGTYTHSDLLKFYVNIVRQTIWKSLFLRKVKRKNEVKSKTIKKIYI